MGEPTVDRAELRRLAVAAPWGPWVSSGGSFGLSTFPPGTMLYTVRREGMSASPVAAHSYSTQGRTADYIAAADPQTVLALLDALDAAEAGLSGGVPPTAAEAMENIRSLQAAARAEPPLTVERLAKALHDAGVGCDVAAQLMVSHDEDAAAILAALAATE